MSIDEIKDRIIATQHKYDKSSGMGIDHLEMLNVLRQFLTAQLAADHYSELCRARGRSFPACNGLTTTEKNSARSLNHGGANNE